METATEGSRGGEVERRQGLSAQDFMCQYVLPLKPVVLTDACRDWPAMRWTPDFFRKHYADLPIDLEGEATTLGKLFERLESGSRADGPGHYLRLLKFEDRLPELLPDITPQPGVGADRILSRLIPRRAWFRRGSPELLIGGAGANFPVLHYDNESASAYVTQVYGSKIFYLYPPSQTPYMYPQPHNRHRSQIDRFDPVDLQRFPLFAKAAPLTTVVHPGETIFVPARWWHMTKVPEVSIAVTSNSVSRSNWADFAYDRAHWDEDGGPDRMGLRYALQHAWLILLGHCMTLKERVTRGY